MAKETGLGGAFFLDGIDLSGDTQMFSRISKSMGVIEDPGINRYAQERLPAVLDGGIDWSSYFNPSNAHLALNDLPRGDRICTYFHKDNVLGTPTASQTGKQLNYDPTRANDGGLLASVQSLPNAFWVDWGLSLTTGKRTDTGATNGTGVDFNNWGGGNSFGLQAYLHVFAFTGTDVTIKLQSSTDNGSGDAYADVTGGAFTAITSGTPQAQRIQTARNQAIERWLRIVTTTTGGFTSVQFAVAVTANRTDMTL